MFDKKAYDRVYSKQYRNEHKEHYSELNKQYYKRYFGHIGKNGIKKPNWYLYRINCWKNRSHIKLIEPYRTYWEMYSVYYIRANKQCEICHKPLRMWYAKGISPEKYKNIETANFDHDHKTGLPRGILCSNCNYVVGIVEKRLNGNAKNISDYIKRFNSGLNELQ